jgi:hypothetical protein
VDAWGELSTLYAYAHDVTLRYLGGPYPDAARRRPFLEPPGRDPSVVFGAKTAEHREALIVIDDPVSGWVLILNREAHS